MRSMREILTLVEDGASSPAQMPSDIPGIHPNVAGIYGRDVERLAEALRCPQDRDEAAEGPIVGITRTPGAKLGEIAATLHGDLGTILEWTTRQQKTPGACASGVSVSVVAGAGFEPATFRL